MPTAPWVFNIKILTFHPVQYWNATFTCCNTVDILRFWSWNIHVPLPECSFLSLFTLIWTPKIDKTDMLSEVRQNIFGQECIPVGCILPACCPYLPACTAPGGYLPRGIPTQGVPVWGYLPRGVSLPQVVYLPGGCTCLGWCSWLGCTCPEGMYLPRVPAQVLPPPVWTEFLTHATENITLPQLHCRW